MGRKKEYDIQILRAIAIIAVVLIHTTPPGYYQVLCRPFINYPVGLFLFLSGYLTKTNYSNWLSFYQRRIIRVLVPYILWSVIYSMPPLGNPSSLVYNLITASAAGHLYYLPVYMQLVLLTPFLLRLSRTQYQLLCWIISPLSIILFAYTQYYFGIGLNAYISLFFDITCFSWFIFYYLGFVLGNKLIVLKFNSNKIGILLILSIILQIIEGYVLLRLGMSNCGTQIKLTSLLTTVLCCIIVNHLLTTKTINIRSKLLYTIGNYSFGIYLCHIFFITVAHLFPAYQNIPYILNTTLILSVSLVFCYACDRLLSTTICKWFGIK